MDVVTQQIAVLLIFAIALLFVNLWAGMTWLKFLTLWAMLACFGAAAWLVVEWVFL